MTSDATNSSKRTLDCRAVAREEIVERYVTGRLNEDDREAFEEHCFHCERCFDELQTLQAIREEARDTEIEFETPPARSRSVWIFGAVAAALVLAIGVTMWVRLTPRNPGAATVVTKRPQPASPPSQGGELERPRTSESAPSPAIDQLARVEPAPYEPVTLRGPADEATSRFRQGMDKYQKRDYAGAVADLNAAADLDPDAAHVRFFLGVSYLLVGEDAAAIRQLQATVELGDSPYVEETHLYLARAFIRERNVQAAKAHLNTVIRLRGTHADEAQRLLSAIERLDKR
jgi:TolA-binding protein